nr:transmembrane inner ear expressed protein isoform X1 [Halichoerus grypus]
MRLWHVVGIFSLFVLSIRCGETRTKKGKKTHSARTSFLEEGPLSRTSVRGCVQFCQSSLCAASSTAACPGPGRRLKPATCSGRQPRCTRTNWRRCPHSTSSRRSLERIRRRRRRRTVWTQWPSR